MKYRSFLKTLLFIGFVYFFAIALVHFSGIKVAGLYLYFQLPSNIYQDRIISVITMGWALFYLQAAIDPIRNLVIVRTLVVSGALALCGLCINTTLINIPMLNPLAKPVFIWFHLLLLLIYLLLLTFSYAKLSNSVQRGRR